MGALYMRANRLCGTCYYWIPLRSNPSLGFCSLNKLAKRADDEGLMCYRQCKPSKFEYMWCKDCDVIISRDDIEEHIFHELCPPPYVEEDTHEETYVAS